MEFGSSFEIEMKYNQEFLTDLVKKEIKCAEIKYRTLEQFKRLSIVAFNNLRQKLIDSGFELITCHLPFMHEDNPTKYFLDIAKGNMKDSKTLSLICEEITNYEIEGVIIHDEPITNELELERIFNFNSDIRDLFRSNGISTFKL